MLSKEIGTIQLQNETDSVSYTGFAAHATGFVGQSLEFFFFVFWKYNIFFPIKGMYVFLLKLGGFLVESEARSIYFSDFSDSEPAREDSSSLTSLWGSVQKKNREAFGEAGSYSLWPSEKLIISRNYWQFKGFFGEAQSLAREFIPCSTACLRRNFDFSQYQIAQAKLKLLPCPISQFLTFLKSES